jgi:hypothetical protein
MNNNSTSVQSQINIPLPFIDDIKEASFWKHPQLIKANNVRWWYLFKNIIEKEPELYTDEITVEDIGQGYFDVHIKTIDREQTYSFKVYTGNEIDEEVEEYIKENILFVSTFSLLLNVKPEHKMIIEYTTDEEEEEPEKVFDNEMCCVCLEEYQDNKKVAKCGHTLCSNCYTGIMATTAPRCAECRADWEGDVETEREIDEGDIDAMKENEEIEVLLNTVDISGVAGDCVRNDGYANTLGYDEEEYYSWNDPPTKYRELGGCDGDRVVVISRLE